MMALKVPTNLCLAGCQGQDLNSVRRVYASEDVAMLV